MKNNIASILATPCELDKAGCEAIARELNHLVADAFALFVKTKNFHWHMSGQNFRDWHRLLDEHADAIFNMIDVLAERVRKVGQETIKSVGEISKLTSIQDDTNCVNPRDMLHMLLLDNKKLVANLRHAHEVCAAKGDCASTSLLENFIDESENRVWYLFETLS